ncbi:MAG: hypothetical protein D6720_01810 [Gammaproteobacteria bacterium]|nr:MAG: hypothetical protein D6720_01810 [Gammaproteobacteria bacterium]
MAGKEFLFSMQCRYQGDENAVRSLRVYREQEGTRIPFELDLITPGFEIFCYAIFTCQHTYLRLNCAERGLLLDCVQGEMHLSTDENWLLQRQFLSFSMRLRSGDPSADTVDYLVERMQRCPVSSNLKPIGDNQIMLAFVDSCEAGDARQQTAR